MQFQGFWVSPADGRVEVSTATFDETELSDHSNWQEAWQNDDPNPAHGYIDPLAVLQDVSRRLVGVLCDEQRDQLSTAMRHGDPLVVNTAEDLARLIQLILPNTLSAPSPKTVSVAQTDAGDEIPFE